MNEGYGNFEPYAHCDYKNQLWCKGNSTATAVRWKMFQMFLSYCFLFLTQVFPLIMQILQKKLHYYCYAAEAALWKCNYTKELLSLSKKVQIVAIKLLEY